VVVSSGECDAVAVVVIVRIFFDGLATRSVVVDSFVSFVRCT
jgi:hypothetical protein